MEYQSKRLVELETRIRDEIEVLQRTESGAREWVTKRDELMKTATDDVVSIYAKMSADAAGAQMATMDDPLAASILSKLKPQVAGAILGEMDAESAAKLTSLMSGASNDDKKS